MLAALCPLVARAEGDPAEYVLSPEVAQDELGRVALGTGEERAERGEHVDGPARG